ncbi:hypothetical protein SAY86_026233 [Trapa natans]|uniref:Uncharacterized protein n=1 Tax=Trapa natans TaxID=22666 RepID=A0AAN7KI71_TRANT|nr:hypothetical protein SAY86_026233 [Trapa natans]
MGGKSSKDGNGGDHSISPSLNDLAQYEAACRNDPRVTTFNTVLHERTNLVINALAADVARQSLSLRSFQELTNSQFQVNQEVVRVILECQRDMWDDKDLFGLIEDYFNMSVHTLNFCTALERCLARARDSHLILQFAVRHFEEEAKEEKEREDGLEGIKFTKTIGELEKFKAAGDPFSHEFFVLLHSVSDQQLSLFKKLQERKKKVDKKLRTTKTWRRVSNILFVAAFISVLVFSVVAAAMAFPPVVTAIAGALTAPIGSVGKWIDSLWKKHQKELESQKEWLRVIGGSTKIAIYEVDSIRVVVDRFRIGIDSLMQKAEFAVGVGGDDAVRCSMDEIKGAIEGFMKMVEDLLRQSHICSEEIRMVRSILSQRLISTPNDK